MLLPTAFANASVMTATMSILPPKAARTAAEVRPPVTDWARLRVNALESLLSRFGPTTLSIRPFASGALTAEMATLRQSKLSWRPVATPMPWVRALETAARVPITQCESAATLRLGQADVAGARRQFKSIVDRAPDLGRAWIGLGAVSMLENDLPTAQAMFRRGLEFMPDHVGSWQILGWCCLLGRDLDAAEEVFTHALELDRNFAECHGGLACVAALRGDRAAAERSIRVAQRLDPNCLSVVYAKSVLAGQSGETERATKMIRDAVAGLAAGSGGLGAVIGRVIGRSR